MNVPSYCLKHCNFVASIAIIEPNCEIVVVIVVERLFKFVVI